MKDLLERRDELYYKIDGLSKIKFSPEARNTTQINDQLKELRKRYDFIRNYIRLGGRRNEEIHTKER